MLRRRALLLAPEWSAPYPSFPRRIGYYLEDHSCDLDTLAYTHPQVMRAWYTRQERDAAVNWSDTQRKTESGNYNSGLHFSGDGPFERELRRKGVQVDKYRLPSTVAIRRVHEMTLLRRRELEKRSAARMQELRDKLAVSAPTWLDETDGPVNPNFLRMVVGRNYQDDIELSRQPIVPAQQRREVSE